MWESIESGNSSVDDARLCWPSCSTQVFTVRRYALHGLCDRNSVRLSHSWTVSTRFDLRS